MNCRIYYLRFISPKASGNGEIVAAFGYGGPEAPTLKELQETYPEKFKEQGVYILLHSNGDNLTVQL